MSFWDASAVLPLLVAEAESSDREKQLRTEAAMIVWWGSRIECYSAIRRWERDGLSTTSVQRAVARLEKLSNLWHEVAPSEALRLRAERLLKVHPLRAADSMQLAAALLACNETTSGELFLTSDARLSKAADAEGFSVQ